MPSSRIPLNIFTILIILTTLPSHRFLELEIEMAFQGMNYHMDQRLLAFTLHISSAPIAFIIGGISGLVSAYGNLNGDLTRIGFDLLSISWLACTAGALHHAIARRIVEHSK